MNGKREPAGQLSRRPEDVAARNIEGLDLEEREMIATGIAARERLYGLPAAMSRDQMAGSFVGRLRLRGELSEPQYQASVIWLEDCRNNAIARCAPKQPGAVNMNATHGGNGDYENRAFTLRSVARYRNARQAVQDKQNELRGMAALFAALSYCVERDVSLDHMIGDLRTALNALAKHYKLDGNGLTGRAKAA